MKLRKLILKKDGPVTTAALIDGAMSGVSKAEDILRSVIIGAKIEEADGQVFLTNEEHGWLLQRINVTDWNSTKETRKILAEFITTMRELKEEEVEVKSKS
jgi:hypothetical protein